MRTRVVGRLGKKSTAARPVAPAPPVTPPAAAPPTAPAWRPLRSGLVSQQGVGRANNEDSALAVDPSAQVPQVRCLLAVADGVGGHDGGELASAAAVQALQQALRELVAQRKPTDRNGWRQVVEGLVISANAQVHQAVGDVAGGTTLTLALVEGNTAHIGHVGDSRFVLVRDGSARVLTRADTAVAHAVQAGRMTPEEAANSPRKHELVQALGLRPRLQVQTLSVDLFAGDRLLLCSDGLHGAVPAEEIPTAMRPEPQAACQALADLAVAHGSRDDVSVVLLEVGREVAPAPPPSRLLRWLQSALDRLRK